MSAPIPLFLKRPIAENTRTDPDDVIVLKRSLERLGLYSPPEWGLTDFTDSAMFEGIREFQRNNGLRVDGVMRPEGETATAMGPLVANTVENGEAAEEALNPSSKPSKKDCDLLNRRDSDICNQVTYVLGPKAGAVCHTSASARYAACLRGTPLHALPPLITGGW